MSAILALVLSTDPSLAMEVECPAPDAWLAGTRTRPQVRRDSRRWATRACRSLGASRAACEVLDAIAVRESSGDPCAVHIQGDGEYGLGLHGLSWSTHYRKWFAPEEKLNGSVFYVPEVSAIVALRILRRAVSRYDASTWVEANAVYGGRIRGNRPVSSEKMDGLFCRRLELAGLDCHANPAGQLGTRLGEGPSPKQEAFVRRLIERRAA